MRQFPENNNNCSSFFQENTLNTNASFTSLRTTLLYKVRPVAAETFLPSCKQIFLHPNILHALLPSSKHSHFYSKLRFLPCVHHFLKFRLVLSSPSTAASPFSSSHPPPFFGSLYPRPTQSGVVKDLSRDNAISSLRIPLLQSQATPSTATLHVTPYL